MSLRPRPSTPRPVASGAKDGAWVWSALGGSMRKLSLEVTHTDMMAALLGKRKEPEPVPEPEPPSPAREPSSESVADEDIALIVMNFDGTLTRAKLFLREPELFEASSGFTTTDSLRGFASMTEDEHIANFGGAGDVAALKEFFEECREAGIQIYLICDGKAKAANYALKEVGLHGLVTGVIGSTDEPFRSDPEVGKYAGVEQLQKELELRRTQILWVASKTPDVQSVAELGVASIQINFDDGLVASALEDMRLATGLLTEEQEAKLQEEKGAADVDGMEDFLT